MDPRQPPSPVDDGMTLRAFMPLFVAARQRDYTGQTIVQMRASTRLWTEPMKDRPIRSFISRDTLQFLTTLRRLPASHGKGRTRLHPSDAIARADAAEQRGEAPRRRTNKTIKQHFSGLRQIWDLAMSTQHMEINIFAGFKFPGTKSGTLLRAD